MGTLTFQVPLWVEQVRFLFATILGNIAVPLYFFLSGYLLYVKSRQYLPTLKKKTKTLLVPYLLWNSLLIIFYLVGQNLSLSQGFFGNSLNDFSRYTWLDWVDCFVGKFTARDPYPILVPMWFIRDLIVLNIIYPIVRKLIERFPFTTFTVLISCWLMDMNLIFVSSTALLFFSLGHYAVKYPRILTTIDEIKFVDIIPIYLLTVIMELLHLNNSSVLASINLILGCLVFYKLSLPLSKNTRVFNGFEYLSQYSFWTFALHSPMLAILQKVYVKIFPVNDALMLIEYFSLTIVTLILCLFSGVLVRKTVPKLYSVLTGDR